MIASSKPEAPSSTRHTYVSNSAPLVGKFRKKREKTVVYRNRYDYASALR